MHRDRDPEIERGKKKEKKKGEMKIRDCKTSDEIIVW